MGALEDALGVACMERDRLKLNIQHLLKQVAGEGTCKGCGAKIWWVKHKNGKSVPYTDEGLNHFADCPQAGKFKR